MTRYTLIIGFLLAWQLLMPPVCFITDTSWEIPAITSILFLTLVLSKKWERNTYSYISAIVVALVSLGLAISLIAGYYCHALIVAWVYAMVAYTATSPYPLSIRMPLIIYTLAYIFMIPKASPTIIIIPAAIIFSYIMCYIANRWSEKSKSLKIEIGPEEPPYSFSLAAAIVAAVGINLCLSFAELSTSSIAPRIASAALLTVICVWLLCSKDWKKNILAVTALALMISLHAVTFVRQFSDIHSLRVAAFVLSVAPVMFHTTAPVFRGMRIVITIYAIYSALNRQTLVSALSESALPQWQQHAVIIAIDASITYALFLMAIHWKRNCKLT